jgi:hypothetical protein
MIYGTEEFNELLIGIIKDEVRHEHYQETVDHAEEMSWHFYGITPDELLDRVRPNEDKVITDYRKQNYEPTTKSAADKSVNIVSKIFNPNLYSIRWEKDKENRETKELKEYTLDYYPKYNSIVNYTKDVVLRKMLADPNAVIVVKPEEIPDSGSEKLKPVLVIYGSENIYYFDDDFYLIFLRKEKVGKVEYHVFEYYDKGRYIQFYATVITKASKNIISILDDGEHYIEYDYGFDIEDPPVWRLRGMIDAKDDGTTVFKSFFYSAVPFWNQAIVHDSDLVAAYIRHMFPQKYEVVEICEYKMGYEGTMYPCRNGQIKHPKFDLIDCPSCGGSGKKPNGPYNVIQFTKDKLSVDGNPLGIDPVGYINVPTDATKMLDERVDKLMRKGMWAINMDVEDEIGAIQSGAAKVIDRQAQYDMLYNIGCVVFEHIENMFYYINKFMFAVESKSLNKKEDDNLPQVNKPVQFDILSVAEMVNNFKVAKDSGLDPNALQIKQQEILTKDMTTNPDLKAFTTLLLDLDPLPGMTDMVIKSNVMSGFNSKEDAVIHFNLKAFTERAITDTKGFVQLEKPQKIEILRKYAKEFISANKPQLEPSFMEQ